MGTENACICQYEKLLLDVYWEYTGVPLHGATVRPYGVLRCAHTSCLLDIKWKATVLYKRLLCQLSLPFSAL